MNKIILFAGITGALIFSSCKKNKDTTPPPTGNTTKILKKYTEINGGKTTVYNLSYDANKRLVSIISADNTESTVFSYNEQGQLIKMEELDTYYKSKHILTITYNNGIPVTGTAKNWRNDNLIFDELLTYTVSNSQVTKIRVQTATGVIRDQILSYDNNGNLAKIELPYYEAIFTYTYGNRKPLFPKIFNFILDTYGYPFAFSQQNEILTETYDYGETDWDGIITYEYTYDANGYVLTSDDGEVARIFEYE